jgi:c(7)-type cytochrome triheme protein
MMRKRNIFPIVILMIVCIAAFTFAQSEGVRKKKPQRHEYGNVVMNNSSEKNKMAPVVYNHWLHRALYTCRLCHVDIGFAMEAGGTKATMDDNKNGLYCGACHNGKEAFALEEKGILGTTAKKNCERCHSYGQKVEFEKDFYKFTKGFPMAKFGDKINWIKTEEAGLIKLKDYLEGVSIKTKTLNYSADTEIKSNITEMPDIIFSHKKHAVWNGCELCHPDIFGVKRGATKYTMQDIFAGKYCGACHGKVSFSDLDCQECHVKDVNE